jgi:hypothetical protein
MREAKRKSIRKNIKEGPSRRARGNEKSAVRRAQWTHSKPL